MNRVERKYKMKNELKNLSAKTRTRKTETPLFERTPGRTDEVRNSDGAFVFEVSDKTRLERFLILGTDAGTFYARNPADLTKSNVDFVKRMIKKDERLVLSVVREIARENRAPKNSGSLFTLAMLFAEGSDGIKGEVRAALPEVARTSTHLFEFAQYIDDLAGWGRAKRGAVADWYTSKSTDSLAYQAVKYRQREGWTHRDLFRLSHPKGVDENVGNFILGKSEFGGVDGSSILHGFQAMQRAGTVKEVVNILGTYKNLPWETIPTQFLTAPEVWKTLFYNGALGQTALLRNVTRFAKIGAFDDARFAGDVAKALSDPERIRQGRVHPVAYANALGIYRDGQMTDHTGWGSGNRRKDWTTNAKVLGGLEAGFYASFATVEPANKVTMFSIDVSGSMTWASPAGLVGLDCMGAAAAMAMVGIRTEPYAIVNAFASTLQELPISDTDSLETVRKKMERLSFGSTNISAPMTEAARRGIKVETFTVWTDNEVNRGGKPSQALAAYRQKMSVPARLAVVGFTASNFTVADPSDRGMMDFVGFDATAPRVMADFSAGRI
jgi:60 kDa SS-A/Ro ribonucleoprotein